MRDVDDSTKIPIQHCWNCGYKIDATSTAVGEQSNPRAGDISMCLSCGAVAIFTKTMRLRRPTPSEQEIAFRDPVVLNAQIVRAHVVGDKIMKKAKRRKP